MKKIYKQIFYLIIILTILFTNTCYCSDNKHIDEATNVLTKMKIVIGDENGDLMLNKSFTRAEFSTIIVRLLSLENNPVPKTQITFEDVSKDFWGYSNIYICVGEGFLVGDGNGKFRPNDSIKYEEVLTIMLRLLNKEKKLEIWPDDYILKAEELGITKNTAVNKGDYLSRGISFIIIYNCLNITID